MATNFDTFLPFDAGAGANVTENLWRAMARHWLGNGPLRGEDNVLAVFADSSGMQIKVPTGKAWMRGHYGEVTSQKTLPVTTAHATLPRIDRVVMRLDPTNNRIELDVIAGTPNASPVPPNLTQSPTGVWEESLARVQVNAAVVTITAGSITSERTWATPQHGGLLGYAQVTANQGSITTITDLTGLTITVNVLPNRRIRITGKVHAQATLNDEVVGLQVREGSTVLQTSNAYTTNSLGTAVSVPIEGYIQPTAGLHTYKLSMQRRVGSTATLTMEAAADAIAFICAEDTGPI